MALWVSVGRIVRLGKLPVNAQAGGPCNVVRADNAAEWQLRIQVQFQFPR